jgi:hypothetical protein
MNLPKHAELWLAPYLRNRIDHAIHSKPAKRLWVALTDHWEPWGGNASEAKAKSRTAAWTDRWPDIAWKAPPDAVGRPPCYTFFYPQEEYHAQTLHAVEPMHQKGIVDVEVHIHHHDDTAEGFTQKMQRFCKQLRYEHGMLRERDGKIIFGFIHGNWALDNSYPDGRLCGVNGEISILEQLGCYADFTMPSLPSVTQGRIVNQIYWATGAPDRSKSYDHGIQATPGGGKQGQLLMITGPVGVRYRGRVMPRLEMGELATYDGPTAYRVKRWIDLAPRIGDDIFLKLHAHGAREDNASALLGTAGLAPMFRWLKEATEERGIELRYASAFEMAQAAHKLTNSPVLSHIDATTTAIAR